LTRPDDYSAPAEFTHLVATVDVDGRSRKIQPWDAALKVSATVPEDESIAQGKWLRSCSRSWPWRGNVTTTYRSVHHGLIVVPNGGPRPGIYWLRLFRSDTPAAVAVVTEVPGNRGMTMTNDARRIWAFLTERFALKPQAPTMYQIWPRGGPGSPCSFVFHTVAPEGTRWEVVERTTIEIDLERQRSAGNAAVLDQAHTALMSVWSMLAECVGQLDEPFRRSEIIGWFRRHHPKVNESTLAAHIQAATANAENRVQNHPHLARRAPLLRRVDHGLYVRSTKPDTATDARP
jgi:hypothetical protein